LSFPQESAEHLLASPFATHPFDASERSAASTRRGHPSERAWRTRARR
jgi:hypothetical protein